MGHTQKLQGEQQGTYSKTPQRIPQANQGSWHQPRHSRLHRRQPSENKTVSLSQYQFSSFFVQRRCYLCFCSQPTDGGAPFRKDISVAPPSPASSPASATTTTTRDGFPCPRRWNASFARLPSPTAGPPHWSLTTLSRHSCGSAGNALTYPKNMLKTAWLLGVFMDYL